MIFYSKNFSIHIIVGVLIVIALGCAPSISQDEKEVLSVRQRSNEAIALHDALVVGESYTQDFTLLSSSNIQVIGKDNMVNIFKQEFETKKDVIYVRTPSTIAINKAWNMASEFGQWRGHWKTEDGAIDISGNYYAKWHKIDGQWFIRSETYTPINCKGGSYCDQTPF